MKTLQEYALAVNARLEQLFPKPEEGAYGIEQVPWLLSDAMRYSVMAGGKRLRPALLLACVDMLGAKLEEAVDFACAVEMIHTYSLIHDDLPGMDNDTMRRGRPTNHVVFGEGQAILAGDGLLNYAVETMLAAARRNPECAVQYLAAMDEVMHGCGVTGMIAGQVLDLYCEKEKVHNQSALEYIQYGKTACMFIYPLRAAARLCGADDRQIMKLTEYGRAFGLLFQATDDLLDVTGNPEEVGKTLGKDDASGKLTCISILGIEKTRDLVRSMHQSATLAMADFGSDAKFFTDLVDSMVERTR